MIGGEANEESLVVLTNKDRVVGDMTDGSSLACWDREMVEFRIVDGGSRGIHSTTSGVKTLTLLRTCVAVSHELGLWKVSMSKRVG